MTFVSDVLLDWALVGLCVMCFVYFRETISMDLAPRVRFLAEARWFGADLDPEVERGN